MDELGTYARKNGRSYGEMSWSVDKHTDMCFGDDERHRRP
jgi:hypothetical protein